MSDEFKDNSEEYEELLIQAIRRGLRAIGMTAETYAKTYIYSNLIGEQVLLGGKDIKDLEVLRASIKR